MSEKQDYQSITELEGYYTTIERPTSLDNSTPPVTCSAFKVTNGPKDALSALQKGTETGINSNIIILKENNSGQILEKYWYNLPDVKQSNKENPVKALFITGKSFEGEAIGCFDPQYDYLGVISK